MIILCSIKPFMYAQKIMVFNDNGDAYTTITTTVKDFAENLCELVEKYQCKKIKMAGNKMYIKGLENKVKECYLAKYKKDDLEIEYI